MKVQFSKGWDERNRHLTPPPRGPPHPVPIPPQAHLLQEGRQRVCPLPGRRCSRRPGREHALREHALRADLRDGGLAGGLVRRWVRLSQSTPGAL